MPLGQSPVPALGGWDGEKNAGGPGGPLNSVYERLICKAFSGGRPAPSCYLPANIAAITLGFRESIPHSARFLRTVREFMPNFSTQALVGASPPAI